MPGLTLSKIPTTLTAVAKIVSAIIDTLLESHVLRSVLDVETIILKIFINSNQHIFFFVDKLFFKLNIPNIC